MLKRGLISLALIFALVISFCGVAFADTLPPVPYYTMTLTVTQSPITIYPPIMIYTAQITPAPISSTQQIVVDFYNAKDITPIAYQLIGSAPVDATGKAVITAQMLPSTYLALSKTVIGSQSVVSNIVKYVVR